MKNPIVVLTAAVVLLNPAVFGQVELTGEISPEQILQNLPDWRAVVDSYTPNLETIAKLQTLSEPIQVEIFLGTWCSDSKLHVSAYLKIMEMVQNPVVQTTYTGLTRNKEARQPFIEGRNIERVPTFVVSVQNQERGRIIETPQVSVEDDLWRILRGK